MKYSKIISAIIAASFAMATTATTANAVPGVAKSTVNVRTGPNGGYAKVDTLYLGENINITQCTGGWCYIEHAGPDGWVSANYIAKTRRSSTTSNQDRAAAAVVGGFIVRSSRTRVGGPAPIARVPVARAPGVVVAPRGAHISRRSRLSQP